MTLLAERRCELQFQRKRKNTEQSVRWSGTLEPPAVRQKIHEKDESNVPRTFTHEIPPLKYEAEKTIDISEKFHQESSMPASIAKVELKTKLPDPRKAGVSPGEYLLEMVQVLWGEMLQIKKGDDLKDHFPVITEKQMAAYDMTVTRATRQNQVKELRALLKEKGRDALDCFNRFGDGLLNIACRRGFKDVVKFLLSDDVQLDVRVHDDFGRTPMHDACWNSEPQIEICGFLMERDPSLFLVADKRCFTPFHYARKCDWHIWRQFIFDRRHLLEKLVLPETLCKFSTAEQI